MANTYSPEMIRSIRALGVKTVTWNEDGEIGHLEFFPQAAPDFGHMDVDTLVPPPPAADEDGPPNARPVPPALARVMKRGSVS